jgi:hypothetical protein
MYMPIFRLTKDAIELLPQTSLAQHGFQERADLQRLLRVNISVVAPDVLVIGEEFAEWEDSKRRIDLLGVDRAANLVVIELKRGDDGGHMELQAIRYAAMVSKMTFEDAVSTFQSFLEKLGENGDARNKLLQFLEWDEPHGDQFAQDVRILLVSPDFSKELTTAVLWLNEHDMDIQCVRLKPYNDGANVYIDAQKIIPLPEASEYQARVRHKAVEEREARRDTGFWFMNTGDSGSSGDRAWEDSRKYGFMSAGDGQKYVEDMKKLEVGDKVFAYLSRHGYVGLGEVTAEAVPFREFTPAGHSQRLPELPLDKQPRPERLNDPAKWDVCVGIKWIKAVARTDGVLKNRSHPTTLGRILQPDLVAELLRHFGPLTDGN